LNKVHRKLIFWDYLLRLVGKSSVYRERLFIFVVIRYHFGKGSGALDFGISFRSTCSYLNVEIGED
jgi:hypothetical protein